MRNKGDTNELKRRQDEEVMAAYRRLFSLHGGKVSVCVLYAMVASAPATRFFVTARQATRVVRRMERGESVRGMREARLRMYTEILRRATALRHDEPGLSLRAAVAAVVRQPAPSMFLSARQVAAIIAERKKALFEERKRRLRHTL